MKKLIIILLFGLLLSSFAEAQTAAWSCDFNTTSCGFDLSSANGYLNVTSSTTMDWSASSYSWSNISTMVYCPTGGNGNKFQSITGSYKWLLDGTNWKNEPSYAISKGTMTLDAWVRMNFVHNHTANTSFVCIAGSCSSAGTWLVVPSTDSMTIETTYAGGKCAYDDMTIYILDSEVPANYSLVDHAYKNYNLTSYGAAVYNSSSFIFNGTAGFLRANQTPYGPLNETFNRTISLWVQFHTTPTNVNAGLAGVAFSWGWFVNGGYLKYIHRNASASIQTINLAFPSLEEWVMLTATWNGTHQVIYKNGIYNATQATTIIPQNIANYFTIAGGEYGGTPNNVNRSWTIKDVRVWNLSLSSSQVSSVYANQSVGCSNLVAWYPFTAANLEVCTPQPRLVWEAHITGVADYGNHSIESVWANTTTGEYATNSTGLTFRIDDNIKPSFNVTNDSITNSSFRVRSNASEASNMSVKYGTTVNLGSTVVNTTSSANLTLNVTGLSATTLYYYNVTRCDANGNCNTTGPYSLTTTSNPLLPLDGTLCSGILSLYWKANITLGRYDPKTKTYNQSTILPMNNSVCGWTYKLNNSDSISRTFTFSTNYTNSDGNLTMFVNGSQFNASSSKAFSVPAGLVYFVNVSVNLTRWPVLMAEPASNLSIVVT